MYEFGPKGTHLPDICLLEEDYELLSDVVCSCERSTPGIELLWQELERAIVVSPDRAPSGLVQLRSLVSFTELGALSQRAAQVTAPGDPSEGHSVSVVTPVGAALIGLKCGDTFPLRSKLGRIRTLRVDAVAHDPQEAAREQGLRAAARRRRIDELLSRH